MRPNSKNGMDKYTHQSDTAEEGVSFGSTKLRQMPMTKHNSDAPNSPRHLICAHSQFTDFGITANSAMIPNSNNISINTASVWYVLIIYNDTRIRQWKI